MRAYRRTERHQQRASHTLRTHISLAGESTITVTVGYYALFPQ